MKCYKHPMADGVGVCVRCGRATCRDCVVIASGDRIVCSPDCTEQLTISDRVAERARLRLALSGRTFAVMCIVFGVGFTVFALYGIFQAEELIPLLFAGFISGAIAYFGLRQLRGLRHEPSA